MDTIDLIIKVVLPTSLLSSLLTVLAIRVLVPGLYRREVKPDIENVALRIADEVEKGVLAAGNKLLPEFENRVRVGFLKGVKEVPSSMVGGAHLGEVIKRGVETLDPLNILGLGPDDLRR